MENFIACFACNMLHHYFCYTHAKVYSVHGFKPQLFFQKNALETKYWMVDEGKRKTSGKSATRQELAMLAILPGYS